MAKKKRKAQARRGKQRRIPLWMWPLVGILIGLGLVATVLIWNRDGELAFPRANPFAKAPAATEPGIVPPPSPSAERPKPKYDFYTTLRERESQVSDRELTERVQAETRQPDAPTASTAAPRERYLLQAGAYSTARDADAAKARIALAGLQARVEAAQVNGQPVYRVRLGPYATARELEDAKNQLAGNGIRDTMAVRESLD